jgi:acetolactate synthase small subunit
VCEIRGLQKVNLKRGINKEKYEICTCDEKYVWQMSKVVTQMSKVVTQITMSKENHLIQKL